MTEEVILAEVPVPEVPTTAVEPTVEVTQPEEVAKTFTQEELDAAIGKRLAREQRKWERERQPAPVPVVQVAPEQFDSTEAYADAVVEQKLAQREFQKEQAAILESYHDKEEEVRAKYDDFEQVAYNPNLRITAEMAQTIQASDIGPEVAYHLGTNPKEADRISRLSPLMQAREIGRIEAKLAADPPVKRTTNAPPPITPITARSTGSPTYDTNDPRSVSAMSMDEWAKADNAREAKKWAERYR